MSLLAEYVSVWPSNSQFLHLSSDLSTHKKYLKHTICFPLSQRNCKRTKRHCRTLNPSPHVRVPVLVSKWHTRLISVLPSPSLKTHASTRHLHFIILNHRLRSKVPQTFAYTSCEYKSASKYIFKCVCALLEPLKQAGNRTKNIRRYRAERFSPLSSPSHYLSCCLPGPNSSSALLMSH